MKKLYTFEDKNLDRQIREIVDSFNKQLPIFIDNTAALAGGLRLGQYYRNGIDPNPIQVK